MFLTWLQETGFFSYIRNSAYAYPVLLCDAPARARVSLAA